MPASTRDRVYVEGKFAEICPCQGTNQGISSISSAWITSSRGAGIKVYDWKGKIARGESATSPLTGLKFSWELGSTPKSIRCGKSDSFCSTKNCVGIGTGWPFGGVLTVPSTAPATSSSMSSTVNKAIACFRNKVDGAVTPFTGGVALGELRETISLIKRPLRGIRGLFDAHDARIRKAMKSSDRRRATTKKILDAAADSWLEAQFGWKPLISDLKNATKALKSLGDDRRYLRCICGTDEPPVIHPGGFGTGTLGVLRGRYQQEDSSKVDVIIRGVVGLSTGFAALPSRLGVDLPSFIPTVWELIPYSFVVDYFTNAGEYLSSLCADRTSQLSWWAQTNRRTTSFVYRAWWEAAAGGLMVQERNKGVITGRVTTFERLGGNGSDFPKLKFSIGSELDWKKILNLTSLLERSRLTSRILGSK